MRKFMKWMPVSLMILSGMFMFAACSDDNDPATSEEPGTVAPEEAVSIKLGFTTLDVEAAGGSAEVTYTLKNAGTNPKLSGTSDQDWISNIQAADGKVAMTVAPNPVKEERTAIVTLAYTDDEKRVASAELTVTQAAKVDEQFTITIPGESGSTWIPFAIQPKDPSALYFIYIRPAEEMEGFISDEALFNSDMSNYQKLAEQYGMSLNDLLTALGLLVSGPMDGYLFSKLEPSTEYCIYCYGMKDGSMSTPVSKVKAATTAAVPVDNQITFDIKSKVATSFTFDVKTTTFDAYAMNVFNGGVSDEDIKKELMAEDSPLYAGETPNVSLKLEPGKEYAIAAIGRAGNTATTQLFVTRVTAEEGQVVKDLTLDVTTLAFDGDELAAHLGNDRLEGGPILFHNIETNGTYTYTYPLTPEELDKYRKDAVEQNPGLEFTDEELYVAILKAYADYGYASPNKYDFWSVPEGKYIVLSMTVDEAMQNMKAGAFNIDVTKDNYSPASVIDQYLGTNASKVLFKKTAQLDTKVAAAAFKKYLNKKYTVKVPFKYQSPVRLMK